MTKPAVTQVLAVFVLGWRYSRLYVYRCRGRPSWACRTKVLSAPPTPRLSGYLAIEVSVSSARFSAKRCCLNTRRAIPVFSKNARRYFLLFRALQQVTLGIFASVTPLAGGCCARAYNNVVVAVQRKATTQFSGRGAIPHRRYLWPAMLDCSSPRAPGGMHACQGQQIWCDARADGHSPDERESRTGR